MTRLLIENGADVNAAKFYWPGGTVLQQAVRSQAPESVLKLLLTNGAHVNFPTGERGYHTVLFDAVSHCAPLSVSTFC